MKLKFLTNEERRFMIDRCKKLNYKKFYNFDNPEGELEMQNKIIFIIKTLTECEINQSSWPEFREIMGYCIGDYGEPADTEGEKAEKIFDKCEVHYAHLFGTKAGVG